MDKSVIIKKVIMALITLLVIIYVIYVICNAGFTHIKTETAKFVTVSDSITLKGYFIRDEKLIEYKGEGVISYIVEDAERVSKNAAVANVFASANDANAKKETERLKAQIDSLEQLEKTADTITVTPDEIDKNIDSLLVQANINVSNGDYSLVDENVNDILYNLNERQLVTGKITDFASKRSELNQQIDTLKKGMVSTKKVTKINSPVAGYFVSSADGYENIFTTKDIESILPDDLSEDKIKPSKVSENVIGKTIEGVYWYIALPVTANQAMDLKNSEEITIELPLASNESIKVALVSVNQETKTSDGVAILRGDYMTPEMANIRNENVVININSYSGIYVPKKAVHECELTKTVKDKNGKEKEVKKTVTGVYVEFGNTLSFRQIFPIYSGDDYVICEESPEEEEIFSDDVEILKIYDDMVVEGADLYDGKLIS